MAPPTAPVPAPAPDAETGRWFDVRETFLDRVTDCAILFVEHIPLVFGVLLTAIIHVMRDSWVQFTVTRFGTHWSEAANLALILAELTMFGSLVVKPALELVTEIAEQMSLARYRIRFAWSHGKLLPEPETQDDP